MPEKQPPQLQIGIDIGGTFTDFVVHDPRKGIFTCKVLSTPANPEEAVFQGLYRLIEDKVIPAPGSTQGITITHGSTVATNALLERKGARTALITTSGFRDVIEIGRQNRDYLYNLIVEPRETIIPRSWRFEIDERVDYQGRVLRAIEPADISDLVVRITKERIESVAVCLLFSFLHPEHEQQIAEMLRKAGFYVSISSDVLPEYREYERTSTTAVNAYVTPIIDDYLASFETSLASIGENSRLRIMQSNGGIISVDEARKNAVRCIVSGPAGGVVGASRIGQAALAASPSSERQMGAAQHLKLITFDMGGTSTDVALVDGQPIVTTESAVGGFPIGIPVLDIHTIGAGGGSIAKIDLGGALRVGPESAGADPGPASYALGDKQYDQPTVTDANVVLGRLPAKHFLGGEMKLDKERAISVMGKLGAELALDAVQTAQGVVDVINAHMERALRLVTIERGHDPADFTLLTFGGAGGLHAVELARRLSIPRVVIPPLAATLSAFGMLVADVIRDYSQTVMFSGSKLREEIDQFFQPLLTRGRSDLSAEGISEEKMRFNPTLDMRYLGQSFELNVPFDENYLEHFHSSHKRNYGISHPEQEVEIVNLRLRATGLSSPPETPQSQPGDGTPTGALLGLHPVVINGKTEQIPLYQGEKLQPDTRIAGPAIIIRNDTTVYLPYGSSTKVDHYLNLLIGFK